MTFNESIKSILKFFDLDIRRISHGKLDLNFRATKLNSLRLLKRLGLAPKTVIDVGVGEFGTEELYKTFPNSKHILIEPVEEFEENILRICSDIKDVEFIKAAAWNKSGIVKFVVNEQSLSNSTVEHPSIPWKKFHIVDVKAVTLNQICKSKNLPTPYLIKIDIDGETEKVLEGDIDILSDTDCIVIEATIEGISESWHSTVFYTIQSLKRYDFFLWDIVDFIYTKEVLFQVDLVFLHKRHHNLNFVP